MTDQPQPIKPDPREPTSNRLLLWGFIMLAIAMLVVIGLLVAGFLRLGSQAATQTHQAATQAQIHQNELASCERENIKTRSDNNAHLGDYVVFSFVAARFLVPTHTETAAQKEITSEFTGKLHAAVADSSWTPPTNCMLAVGERGAKYTSPTPVSFSTRLPPPWALPAR